MIHQYAPVSMVLHTKSKSKFKSEHFSPSLTEAHGTQEAQSLDSDWLINLLSLAAQRGMFNYSEMVFAT